MLKPLADGVHIYRRLGEHRIYTLPNPSVTISITISSILITTSPARVLSARLRLADAKSSQIPYHKSTVMESSANLFPDDFERTILAGMKALNKPVLDADARDVIGST